ncbi:phosphotransferase [Maritimibacter sp. DP07]|jgi:aminoglycoside phosphotransferase (APT) family kinase protein|uniref:Phosphotransferase n=1 Tax=Maritimibacter harenae TaxID=2606218 RepID=A0A845LWP9_9RHOB|nr:phosphotransferase family protein [Maritimibacter harenae]MZR12370.1 phosphotransferase [Maritimibacter harenae]
MTKTQQLDTKAVAAWLERHMPGFEGPIEATKFDVGQSNPTFRLDTPKGPFVLRRKPPGQLLKSAHAVDREFRVQKALADTDVPVAKMHVLCEDPDVIGSDFYVMEAVEGRNIDDPRIPDVSNDERRAIYDEMCRVLAAIHDVDIEAVGLSDYGPPGNYFERQIGRWTKQYRASETESIADMDALIDWLPGNIPDDDQRRLVHGDYRIDNMLFETDGPRCAAVLDWELSTIGHPYADLASLLMQWQMPPGAEGRGLAGVDRAALGIPTDEEFVAMYCKARGIDGIAGMNFYLAFAFFRMGAIIQGVYKRALDGNASNPERAMRLGAAVPQFAAGGLRAAHG